ncbi:MAG TPA: DUF4395 domain-containing protein [Gaiellaceae bacterium]|nr:DUF4395 domain-containing protein [Gaiellaceae bacterium]
MNETSARLVAAVVAVLAVVAIAFQQGWILPVLAYGFIARALTGPKLSPLAFVVTRFVTPRIDVRHQYAPGPAKRFAQTIGALFSGTAVLLWYAAGEQVAALVLAGIIALFAALESGLGLCVGCKAFYLGMRLGIVPPSVCEDCAPYVAA